MDPSQILAAVRVAATGVKNVVDILEKAAPEDITVEVREEISKLQGDLVRLPAVHDAQREEVKSAGQAAGCRCPEGWQEDFHCPECPLASP